MNSLLSRLQELLAALAAFLLAYKQGRNAAEKDLLAHENEKLKQGLNAAVNGDYSADAVRERLQKSRPDK